MSERYIITPGACGTHALIDFMGSSYSKRDHHRRNSNSFQANSKIVYLFANPYDTILSFFRRNDQGGKFLESHCKHMEGNDGYFHKKKITLEEFLKDPNDPFMLEDHYLEYVNNVNRNYDLLVVRYDTLKYEGPKSIIDFWGLDIDPSKFKFIKRNSCWTDQSEEIQDLFYQKYGKFKDMYDQLPNSQLYKREN